MLSAGCRLPATDAWTPCRPPPVRPESDSCRRPLKLTKAVAVAVPSADAALAVADTPSPDGASSVWYEMISILSSYVSDVILHLEIALCGTSTLVTHLRPQYRSSTATKLFDFPLLAKNKLKILNAVWLSACCVCR